MHCKLWSKGKLIDKKDQVKELLLQFTRRRVGLRIFSETIKKEKEKKREVGNLPPGNNNNSFIRGKEKKEHFPACKYCKKTNHLEAWCWLKNAQCRTASNLVTSKDSAKIKQKLNNKLK